MKKIVLIIIILLQTNFVSSQEISKTERIEFEITKIESYDGENNLERINLFNKNGDLIKIIDGEKEVQKEFIYNNKKQLLKEIRYNSNGKIHNTIKHFYNPKNQLIKKELTDSDGKTNDFWTFEYNEKNELFKETKKSETGTNSITEFKYNNSKLVETFVKNKTIGKESKTTFKYAKNGLLSQKKAKYYFSNTTMTWKYTYNKKGKLAKLVDKSSNGMKSTTKYEYDKNGLLIKESWRGSFSKEDSITNYKFE
mgnify:CR=1 FL=1|tara:strand:+ start:30 stop:788 length:759 start_codon:yes stop_codon:yes gene_type:complete